MNRVPREKIERGLAPICGRCKTRLPVAAKSLTVTDATFGVEVEGSSLPVLLDFWAPWCGPCRQIAPLLEELASEMAGRVRVGKINVDENQATAARFRVSSIPTLIIFKNGQEVDRLRGLYPKPEIMRRLERFA
jgi:thioredoxin